MTKTEIRKKIKQLFESQKLAILATIGKSYPYQNIVAIASSSDLKSIIFTTKQATSKYKNLKRSKKVSIFLDDRINKESDFKDASGLTAIGNASEASGVQKDKALLQFLKIHPYLKEFTESKDCSVFIVKVKIYYLVVRFQEVIEVHMDKAK